MWNITALVLCVYFLSRLASGLPIESNLLALLPATEADPIVEKAVDTFSDKMSRQVVFLINSEDEDAARAAAVVFHERLTESGLFSDILFRIEENQQRNLYDSYASHRTALLSEDVRSQLHSGQYEQLKNQALAKLYSPAAAMYSALLERDPLLFFTSFLSELSSATKGFTLDHGMLVKRENQKLFILVSGTLEAGVFSSELQQHFIEIYHSAKESSKAKFPQVEILTTGMIYYAAEGTQSAQHEISTIGLGSSLGIVILILLAFRSFKPIIVSFIPIVMGFVAATVACIVVFEKVHLLTLVFGASLIGVSIDYSMHFFAEIYVTGTSDPDDEEGNDLSSKLRKIFPGLTMGLITSIISYLALCIAPFPGLQQIAVFSTVGLVAAYCCVLFWYPKIFTRMVKTGDTSINRISTALIDLWDSRVTVPGLICLMIVIMVVIVMGFTRLSVNDDIRMLQHAPQYLLDEEKAVKAIFQSNSANQFFVIQGVSPQAILESEEKLRMALDDLVAKGKLGSYTGLSQAVPSLSKQSQNVQLLQKALTVDSPLYSYFADVGFSPDVVNSYTTNLGSATEHFLQFEDWIQSTAAEPYRLLWLGEIEQGREKGYASLVILNGVTDLSMLKQIAPNYTGVSFVDRVGDISNLLKRYREVAIYLLASAYTLILGMLLFRYKARQVLIILLPAAMAAGLAVSITSLLGVPMNLFNTLALILVLGISVDYSIFFAEKARGRNTTMLAVLLSAVETILSFGLLALSETPLIQSFGLMVLLGIGFVFILSPMVGAKAFAKHIGHRLNQPETQ